MDPLGYELTDFLADVAPELKKLEKRSPRLARQLVSLWQTVFALEHLIRKTITDDAWQDALKAVSAAFTEASHTLRSGSGTGPPH